MALFDKIASLCGRDQQESASFQEVDFSDAVNRCAHPRIEMGLLQAGFQETCHLENFDRSAVITLYLRLLDAVFYLKFLARHEHVLLVAPSGRGKTFLVQVLVYARHVGQSQGPLPPRRRLLYGYDRGPGGQIGGSDSWLASSPDLLFLAVKGGDIRRRGPR